MRMLAKNLKYLRDKNGISQNDLAKELKISQTSIAHYELGERQPSIDTLINMATFYNTSIDMLVGNAIKSDEEVNVDENELILKLVKCLIQKNKFIFYKLMKNYIADRYDFKYIVENYLVKIMGKIGELWEVGLISEADEHYSTNVIRKITSVINLDVKTTIKRKKSILFTVNTEQHTLGLEIVSDYLEILGVETLYLGNDINIGSISKVIDEFLPDYIFISVTMDISINDLIFVIEHLIDKYKDQFIIGVGGQGIDSFKTQNKYNNVIALNGLNDIKELVE